MSSNKRLNFLDRIALEALGDSVLSGLGRWTAVNGGTGKLLVFDPEARTWFSPVVTENPETGERLYYDDEYRRPAPRSNGELRAMTVTSAVLERELSASTIQ